MTGDTINPIFNHSEYTKTQGNSQELHQKFCRKHEKLNFLINCVVPLWSSLSKSTVSARSVESLKVGADQDWTGRSGKIKWDELASSSRV